MKPLTIVEESYDPLSSSALAGRNTLSVSLGDSSKDSPDLHNEEKDFATSHNVMKQSSPSDNPSGSIFISEIRSELNRVRAELTDATCWRRTLYHELEMASNEVKQLTKLQHDLLIREAELSGKIEKVGRQAKVKGSEHPTSEMSKIFASLNEKDQADLVASLLKDFTKNLSEGE